MLHHSSVTPTLCLGWYDSILLSWDLVWVQFDWSIRTQASPSSCGHCPADPGATAQKAVRMEFKKRSALNRGVTQLGKQNEPNDLTLQPSAMPELREGGAVGCAVPEEEREHFMRFSPA